MIFKQAQTTITTGIAPLFTRSILVRAFWQEHHEPVSKLGQDRRIEHTLTSCGAASKHLNVLSMCSSSSNIAATFPHLHNRATPVKFVDTKEQPDAPVTVVGC